MADIDLTCKLEYGNEPGSRPRLVIEFDGRAMTMDQVKDLSRVLGKTAKKWASCRGCDNAQGSGQCGESYAKPGGDAPHVH